MPRSLISHVQKSRPQDASRRANGGFFKDQGRARRPASRTCTVRCTPASRHDARPAVLRRPSHHSAVIAICSRLIEISNRPCPLGQAPAVCGLYPFIRRRRLLGGSAAEPIVQSRVRELYADRGIGILPALRRAMRSVSLLPPARGTGFVHNVGMTLLIVRQERLESVSRYECLLVGALDHKGFPFRLLLNFFQELDVIRQLIGRDAFGQWIALSIRYFASIPNSLQVGMSPKPSPS